jgi:hypothetical protein
MLLKVFRKYLNDTDYIVAVKYIMSKIEFIPVPLKMNERNTSRLYMLSSRTTTLESSLLLINKSYREISD